MALDPGEVTKVARLARLELSPGEAEARAPELDRILALVEQMEAVDTRGIEPMAHPLDQHQRLRPDRVSEVDRRERLQACAPEVRDGLYLVPRFVD